jgi:hypothetical protein
MKTKQVTYDIREKTKLTLEIESLMNDNKSLSEIVSGCLRKGFEIMEKAWLDNNKKPINYKPKIRNTLPVKLVIPMDVLESLEDYSEKLGILTSHLVMLSVEIVLNKR